MIRAKQSLADVTAYAPGRPIDEIKRKFGLEKVVKLASNENPLGAPASARAAVKEAADNVFLYPDPDAYSLRVKLAKHLGVLPENLIFGTGSDGLIELVCKTFLEEGDECLMPHPSFSLYELNVLASGGVVKKVDLSENGAVSPEKLGEALTENTRILWLCNPNNPTGGMYTEKEQRALLAKVPDDCLIVIDEAYFEYAEGREDYPDSLALLGERDNVLILRTFSKIYGLAGLRIGYGIAPATLIAEMEKVRPPFNVCAPAQAAAMAALEDSDFVSRSLSENAANKAFLEQKFTEMGLSYLDSATNFIAVDTGRDAKCVFEKLLERGYIVKGGHVLGLPGYLRVTIGTKEECEGFCVALAEVLKEI